MAVFRLVVELSWSCRGNDIHLTNKCVKTANMAIIQYTAVVNQIRGKLNGSVFNKTKTGYTLQRKQQQSKGDRGFQSEIRGVISN